MKKYYVGYIIKKESVDSSYTIGNDLNFNDLYSDFVRLISDLNGTEQSKLKIYFKQSFHNKYNKEFFQVDRDYIINILNNIDFDTIKNIHTAKTRIIYSIVTDEKGNKYAEEYKTGYLFPLYDKSCVDRKYYLKSEYQNTSAYSGYYSYILVVKDFIANSCFHKIGNIVIYENKASKEDLESYNLGMNSITECYKQNSFQEDVILKDEIDSTPTLEMVFMQSIEYNLGQLKQVNEEDYNELKKEFDFILKNYNNSNSNVELSNNNLINFNNKVLFKLLFNSSNEVIYNTNIKYNEIDHYYELFLKYGNTLSLDKQNAYLKQLASLYINKVKEEDVSKEVILDSHFIDLIKYICVELNCYSENIDEIIELIKGNQVLKMGK